MRLNIRCRGVEDPAGVREHVRKRLGFALARFEGRLSSADVVVTDENGPKGGPAMRCDIAVRGDRGGEIRATDGAADPLEAVDLAAGRVARAVARAMERSRDPYAGPLGGRSASGV